MAVEKCRSHFKIVLFRITTTTLKCGWKDNTVLCDFVKVYAFHFIVRDFESLLRTAIKSNIKEQTMGRTVV